MRLSFMTLVIAVIAAVAPSFALAGNQEVAQEIAGQLKASGQLSDYNVNIKYENGTCKLMGRVTTQQQKVVAEAIVRKVAEVQTVQNELTVGPSTAKKPAVTPAQYQPMPAGGVNPQMAQMQAAQAQMAQQAQAQIPQMAARNAYPMNAGMNNGMNHGMQPMQVGGGPTPAYVPGNAGGIAPVRYDQPNLPNHAWPSYAAYPNYAAVTYPRQYSATAWPFIGPFYPYPQVPLGWRKVTLEWDDGWWMLDFKD
jgi:hypothetical protein